MVALRMFKKYFIRTGTMAMHVRFETDYGPVELLYIATRLTL
jgi:hypothetical protein